MPKSKSSSGYASSTSSQDDPPPSVGTLSDLDKAIAAHQQLLREIPFRVLQPLADQALERIRQKAAELAIPELVATPEIARSTLGQTVTLNTTGETGIILQSALQSHSPEEVYHTILTASGRVVTVKSSDTSPGPRPGGAPTTVGPTGTLATPTTAAPVTLAGSTPPFQPGERVTSPVGVATIMRISSANPEMYEVTNSSGESFFFPREALRVP